MPRPTPPRIPNEHLASLSSWPHDIPDYPDELFMLVKSRNSGNYYLRRYSFNARDILPIPSSEYGDILRSISEHTYAVQEKVADMGKLTGRCCVCNRSLSDPESQLAGIGPICASRVPTPVIERVNEVATAKG